MSRKKTLLIFIVVLVAVAFSGCAHKPAETGKNNPVENKVQNEQFKITPDSETQENSLQWKKYSNDKFGFEFEYPGNLIAQDDSRDDLTLLSFYVNNNKGPLLINISIKSGTRWSLAQREKDNKSIKSEVVTTKRITFQDVPALKTQYAGNDKVAAGDEIYFVKNNASYILSFVTNGKPNIASDEDKILESFKFNQ